MRTMNSAKKIIDGLIQRIETAGFSVSAVCKRAAIDPALVSRWKHGRVEPRLSTVERISAALDQLIAERGAHE